MFIEHRPYGSTTAADFFEPTRRISRAQTLPEIALRDCALQTRIALVASWHRCCATAISMMNITTLAVVLTLAGSPVATLTCVGWCVLDSAHANAACHDEMGTSGATGLRQADDTCARLLAVSPFLVEKTELTAPAMATVSEPLGSSISVPGEAQLTLGRDVCAALPHRSTSALVLRL